MAPCQWARSHWWRGASANCRKLDTPVVQLVADGSSPWRSRKETHQIKREPIKSGACFLKTTFILLTAICQLSSNESCLKVSVFFYFHVLYAQLGEKKNGQKLLNNPWPCIEQLDMVTNPRNARKCIKVSNYKRSIFPAGGHKSGWNMWWA